MRTSDANWMRTSDANTARASGGGGDGCGHYCGPGALLWSRSIIVVPEQYCGPGAVLWSRSIIVVPELGIMSKLPSEMGDGGNQYKGAGCTHYCGPFEEPYLAVYPGSSVWVY